MEAAHARATPRFSGLTPRLFPILVYFTYAVIHLNDIIPMPRARRLSFLVQGLRCMSAIHRDIKWKSTKNMPPTMAEEVQDCVLPPDEWLALAAQLGLIADSDDRARCPLCNTIFSRPADAKRHQRTVHGSKRVSCTICVRTFARSVARCYNIGSH